MLRLDRLTKAGSGLCLALGLAVGFPNTVVSQPRSVRGMPQRPGPNGSTGKQSIAAPRAGYGMTTPLMGFTGSAGAAGVAGRGAASPFPTNGFGASNSAAGANLNGLNNGNFTGFGSFPGIPAGANGFYQSPNGAAVVSQPNVAMPLISAPIYYNGLNGLGAMGGFNGAGGGFNGMSGLGAGFGGFNGAGAGFNGMSGPGVGFNGFGGSNGMGPGMTGFNNFNGMGGKPGAVGFGGFNGGHGL